MAVLDLQGMKSPEKGPPSGSRTSKGCTTQSAYSVLLCTVDIG